MLNKQRWGLTILVSQKLARALPKPTWRVVLGEDQWRSSKATRSRGQRVTIPILKT
jgi:hypothetical protein